MPELDDHELLADFARNGSETAFATLASRHLSLVYSAALRFTGNPHQAEEIAQAVFIILARKAGKLSPRVLLSGWLYQTARLTAANFIKGESRRRHREQEVYMQSALHEPESRAWEQIAPLLDEAMGALGDTDRNAVVLRYFENRTAAEIGAALRMNEETARRRVNRALEKLRKTFTKRGVSLSAAVIAGAVSANSVQAAPVGLAATVTATAAKGTLISATITTLVNGTMKTLTWLKLKFAVGVGVAVLSLGGVVAVATSGNQSSQAPSGKNASGASQILIKSLFVKTLTNNVEAITKLLGARTAPIDPTSKAFQDLLQRRSGVQILAAPQVITADGREAVATMTRAVIVNGVKTNVGQILDVTPKIKANGQISLKVKAELRELRVGPRASVRSTTIETQILPADADATAMISVVIGGPGATASQAQDKPAEILFVFIHAEKRQSNPYPGDWIWEPNSQTLERVPPIFLLRPSTMPARAVPFDIFGKDRFLTRGKTDQGTDRASLVAEEFGDEAGLSR